MVRPVLATVPHGSTSGVRRDRVSRSKWERLDEAERTESRQDRPAQKEWSGPGSRGFSPPWHLLWALL